MAYVQSQSAMAQESPLSDPRRRQDYRRPQHTPHNPFSNNEGMQEALKDVIEVRPLKPQNMDNSNSTAADSYYGPNDILAAYSESPASSPIREHPSQRQTSLSQEHQSHRHQQHQQYNQHHSHTHPPAAPTGKMGKGGVTKVGGSGGGGVGGVVGASTSSSSSSKKNVPFDVIDRLDISGLYGGGALYRHDGPYAAATASRNKGPRAPIAAFDPSTLNANLSNPNSSKVGGGRGGVSDRAAAALHAMDSVGDSPYGVVVSGGGGIGDGGAAMTAGHPGVARRVSDSSVTMGFPSSSTNGKGAQLIEMYGVRDNEAWEDYGRHNGDYDYNYSGENSHASSKDSFQHAGVSKEDRIERAQSIWDIEATLREGKPVGQTSPPSAPMGTDGIDGDADNNNKPKRSKSLAARFGRNGGGGGRKQSDSFDDHNNNNNNNNSNSSSNSPQDYSFEDFPKSSYEQRPSLHELRKNSGPLHARLDDNGRWSPATSPTSRLPSGGGLRYENEGVSGYGGRFGGGGGGGGGGGPPLSASAMYTGGYSFSKSGSKSKGSDHDDDGHNNNDNASLGRRPSVMQRLFAGKKSSGK